MANVFPAQIYMFQIKVVCLSTQTIFHQVDPETPKGSNLPSTCEFRKHQGTAEARGMAHFPSLLANTFQLLNWGISPSQEPIPFFRKDKSGNISAGTL